MGFSSGFFKFISDLNPINFIKYNKRCYNNFGKFMTLLITQNFLVKGLGIGIVEQGQTPYYLLQGFPNDQITINMTISKLPQSLKGLMGVLADSLPIFGYQKTSYMVITATIAFICSIIICLLPYNVTESFPELPALIFFLIYFETTFHELMCQGKFVEKMQEKPETKSDLVTFVWIYSALGSFIPSLTVGFIADYLDIRYLFIVLIFTTSSPFIVLSMGCMVDDKVPKEKSNKFDTTLIKKQWPILLLSFSIGLMAIVSLFMGIFANSLTRFIFSLVVSTFLAAFGFMCLPFIIAKANLWIFLSDTAYLDIKSSIDMFYMGSEACVPGGPHFSFTYYQTYTSVVGTFAEFFGLFLFQTVICQYKLRTIYWFSTILKSLACLVDIIIIQRWNIAVGIPDEVMFMLGNAIIYKVVYQLEFMPTNFLLAKLCPPKVEATVYAILAGFSNFGVSLAGYIGVYLLEVFNVHFPSIDSDNCVYGNLSLLVFVSHGLLPVIILPLVLTLVPNIYLYENIINDSFDIYESKMGKIAKKFFGFTSQPESIVTKQGLQD